MGTRSLTYVYADASPKVCMPVVCMYRQFDGYPTGHGAELAQFLDGFKIVNGYGEVKPKLANGMGCLEPVELGQDCCQDYEYHVYQDLVTILDSDRSEIFTGTWQQFYDFCVEKEAA
jgi:hypothetical protein